DFPRHGSTVIRCSWLLLLKTKCEYSKRDLSIFGDSDAPSDGGIAVIGQNSKNHRRGRSDAPRSDFLDPSASTVRDKRYDRSDQKYDEQYLCDAGRSGGNAAETKQSCY